SCLSVVSANSACPASRIPAIKIQLTVTSSRAELLPIPRRPWPSPAPRHADRPLVLSVQWKRRQSFPLRAQQQAGCLESRSSGSTYTQILCPIRTTRCLLRPPTRRPDDPDARRAGRQWCERYKNLAEPDP